MTIHFICRGNVLRSLIAETYLRFLNIPDVNVISSGTGVDYFGDSDTPYFLKTTEVLKNHGLGQYIKTQPDQLTQKRLKENDITIVLNERVYEEATKIVDLPDNTVVWSVIDIGEGTRIGTHENGRELEEIIYDEVTTKVDELVNSLK